MAKGDTSAARAAAAGSKYVVLERPTPAVPGEEQVCWVEVGTVVARDRGHAIRVHTGDGPDVIEGTFKAVPLASWKGSVVTTRVTAASRKVID